MELVSTEAFITWARDHDIGGDPNYPRSASPTFLTETSTWYRYRRAAETSPSAFLATALLVAAAGAPIWLFPWRAGRWFTARNEDAPWLLQARERLAALGVPGGFEGALRVTADEMHIAAGLLAVAMDLEAVWSLIAVPAHARCLIGPDHDGDLMAIFPDEHMCASFTAAFSKAGWREPQESDPRVSETDPWLAL